MDKHYDNVMKLIAKHGGVNANFLAALKIQRDKEYKEELLRIKIRARQKEANSVASGGSLPITEEELRYHLKEKKWSLFSSTNFNFNGLGIMLRLRKGLIHAASKKNYYYVANLQFLNMSHTMLLADLNYWLAGVYEIERVPTGLHYEIDSSLNYNDVRTLISESNGRQEGYKRTKKGQNRFGVLIDEDLQSRFESKLKDNSDILSFKLLEKRQSTCLTT